MENASLTISLPRAMKKSIQARLREGNFSTPSEYIRFLIRIDLERSSRGEPLEAFMGGALDGQSLPALDGKTRRGGIETVLAQRSVKKQSNGRNGSPLKE